MVVPALPCDFDAEIDIHSQRLSSAMGLGLTIPPSNDSHLDSGFLWNNANVTLPLQHGINGIPFYNSINKDHIKGYQFIDIFNNKPFNSKIAIKRASSAFLERFLEKQNIRELTESQSKSLVQIEKRDMESLRNQLIPLWRESVERAKSLSLVRDFDKAETSPFRIGREA